MIKTFTIILSLFISNCAHNKDMSEYMQNPMPAITQAIIDDDVRLLNEIVEHVRINIDTTTEHGSSLLMTSVVNGSRKSAKRLLELGADPDFYNETLHSTPLVEATKLNEANGLFMVNLLLDFGADPNAYLRDLDSVHMPHSPLTNASALSLEITERLLDAGADPNLFVGNRTALSVPLITSNTKMFKLMLCKGGANLELPVSVDETGVSRYVDYFINRADSLSDLSDPYGDIGRFVVFAKLAVENPRMACAD